MFTRKSKYIIIFAVVAALAVVLVGFECTIEIKSNRNRAYETSSVIINQVKDIIVTEESKSSALVESLKEDYITRAKAVSYIIDHNPGMDKDLDELTQIADLMSVDEIHLFDATGTIYGGTTPQYYNFNFDSGEQMAYFKPMLEDHTLVMCQDITPNTAEGKEMMYAICWNNDKTHMVQVGIKPVRLINEMHMNQMSELIGNMTSYDGVEILVAEKDGGKIVGDSKGEAIGQTFADIGFELPDIRDKEIYEYKYRLNGRTKYCSVCGNREYIIAILQDAEVVNHGVPMSAFLLSVYITLGAIFIIAVIRRLNKSILMEQEFACTDELTGICNRRGYEESLTEISEIEQDRKKDLIYCSMDLNGLKKVNDTMGHAEGDRLIKGAAECIKKSFADHGKVYRIGGDEFAAIIIADKDKLETIIKKFKAAQEAWSIENKLDLSISLGCAALADYPDRSITELSKTADAAMYEEKQAYYNRTGYDRRSR